MKTKFVRFNKLPRIDGRADADSDGKNNADSKEAPSTSYYLKRGSELKNNSHHILDSLEDLLKKVGKPAYEVEARDREVIVDLPDVDDNTLDDDTLKEWITEVVRCVFSSAFNAISHTEMSFDHAKCFCSENILKNIIFLTKRYRLSKEQLKVIDSHVAERLIPYFQRKYPLT